MKGFTGWNTHGVKRSGQKIGPRAALSGLALVGGLALMAAFYLALASQTAVMGRHLQEMEATRAALMRENAALREQVAHAASVSRLRQRAVAAGFVSSGTVVFIDVPLPGPGTPLPGEQE